MGHTLVVRVSCTCKYVPVLGDLLLSCTYEFIFTLLSKNTFLSYCRFCGHNPVVCFLMGFMSVYTVASSGYRLCCTEEHRNRGQHLTDLNTSNGVLRVNYRGHRSMLLTVLCLHAATVYANSVCRNTPTHQPPSSSSSSSSSFSSLLLLLCLLLLLHRFAVGLRLRRLRRLLCLCPRRSL